MADKKQNKRTTLIALILVMVIICGILTGAIFVIVRNKRIVTDEELVTDAFTQMKKDGDSEYCFHIPKINKKSEKIEEINKEIYDTLYKEYSPDDKSAMHYEWATKGNTLSIVVEKENIDEEKPDFFVFNVDIKDEEALSVSDMCKIFGLSEDEFYDKSRDAVEKYSEREKQYFSKEDQEAYINEVIESTLSDSSIKEALPFIDENEKLCIIVPAFTPGTRDTYLHMIEFDTGAAKENIGCDKSHNNTSTVIITEGATAEAQTTEEETSAVALEEQKNDEWKAFLTKVYWKSTVQSHHVYRFMEDGTLCEYSCGADSDHDMYELYKNNKITEDMLTLNHTYTYTVQDDYIYINGFFGKMEWVNINDNCNWDQGISHHFPTDENFFYSTEWYDTGAPSSNAFYLLNTHCPVGHYAQESTTEESAPLSSYERDKKIFTEYLQNGGFNKMETYQHKDSIGEINLFTCMTDFENDGTYELIVNVQSESMGLRGPDQTTHVLTIRNGKVNIATTAYHPGGSGGGEWMHVEFNQNKNEYVIVRETEERAGVTEVYGKNEYFYAASGFTTPAETFDIGVLDPSSVPNVVEKIKQETDLYSMENGIFHFYKHNEEYVDYDRYTELHEVYVRADDSKFEMNQTSFADPII